MFISVVIPVYNVRRYVEDCLKALLAQDYPEDKYEVLCVDNGSTDGSTDIIRRYPRARLLATDKRGAYIARNLGVEKATGEVIAFTDPDCIPEADWLKGIAGAMGSAGTGIVLGSRRSAGETYLVSLTDAYENSKKEFVLNGDAPELYFGYTNNMAVRSTLFEELGPFVEIPRGADTVFVSRVVGKFSCSSVRYCPEVRVRHMEMNSLMDYYRKQFIFARSSRRYSRISANRPLNFKENLIIFHKAAHRSGFKYPKSLSLFFVLAVGKLFWTLGRLCP